MKIVISNDDGIHATGINTLNMELSLGHEVVMVAPDRERSSCGHGLTLGDPIRVKELEANKFSCSGLPADCILVGLGQICKDDLPDLIISGINHGANLGQDRYYSGTIAAAREAAFRRCPSIAVSLVTSHWDQKEDQTKYFDVAAKYISVLVRNNIHKIIPKMSLININIPNLPMEQISGTEITFSGFQLYSEEVLERKDIKGESYFWIGGSYKGPQDIKGSDGNAILENKISVELQDLAGTLTQNERDEFRHNFLELIKTKNEKT